MAPKYQPGRTFEVMTDYLSGKWFESADEVLVMATEYELMLELEHERILSMGGYAFLSHALKRLFAVDVSSTLSGHGNVDTWNVEVELLPEGFNWEGDDDDSDSVLDVSARGAVFDVASLVSVFGDASEEPRRLAKKSTKQARLFRAVVTFEANDFEHGLSLKSSMDTAFMVALQTGLMRAYVHRAFYSQVSEEFVDDTSAEEYEAFVGMVKLKHGNFSSRYGGNLVPKSSRPEYDWYSYYNISWADSDWDDDYVSSQKSTTSVPWYEWALDPVDIVIIVFVPICTINAMLVLFYACQKHHEKVISDWGYEIHMDTSANDYIGNNSSLDGVVGGVGNGGGGQVEMSAAVHNPMGSY
jgi:hypothetical protein